MPDIYIKGYNIGDSTVIRLSGSNAVESPMLVATKMPNKTHTQIYLQFLNEYKQLTAYELLILKKLFDERLKYFNHENDYLIFYSELPKGGDLITIVLFLIQPKFLSMMEKQSKLIY